MPPDPSEVYEDDPSIADDELLYRRIARGNTKFVDGVAERPGTNAFQDLPAERLEEVGAPAVAVSICLGSVMAERGVTPEDIAARVGPGYGVAAIRAGDARAEGQGITRWPTDEEPEHGMIFALSGAKKSSGASKRLAKASRVVVPPP